MHFFKRIFLFIVVNALVLLTISITTSVLGVNRYITAYGLDMNLLLGFCAVCGFSGAIISLLISRWMAKMMMGVQVINPSAPASGMERDLLNVVQRLSQKAQLPAMPEVGIYESPEINAFATGPSKSRSLVAVSSGLLQRMDPAAIEGVLGHEIAHIANGDMVTMALIQGIVNTFVMFFARILAWGLAQAMAGDRNREEGGSANPWVYHISVFVFEIVFTILGSIVVAYFSRKREYRADTGGARVAGKEKMIHALQSLQRSMEIPVDEAHPSMATLKINGRRSGFLALFSTHPDLEDRIQTLRTNPI